MRLLISVSLILTLAGFASAQATTTTTTTTPVTVYENSSSVMDSVGNLVVIDSGVTYTPGATGNGRYGRFGATPATRITIIQPGGAPMTQQYTASIQLVGAGQLAVYAVATYSSTSTSGSTTTETQNLIAINAQLGLPSAITAFPSWPITTRAQVQVDTADTKADYISIVDLPSPQPANSTNAAQRNAVVVQFTGGASGTFQQVSSGTLP